MVDILDKPRMQNPLGHEDGEIHMDTLTISREQQLQLMEDQYLEQLIKIDEEMGTDDICLLKFILRDEIGGSKLETITSAIDIFHHLRKQDLIRPNEHRFLIECLGLIHRFDLIRKLGFDPPSIDGIKKEFQTYRNVNGFRKLLLEVAEDLDDTELNKMKFLLSGTVRKKRLQDFDTVPDLIVYMEKEELLSHRKTELLCDLLTNIKRTDLVNRIKEFKGPHTIQSSNGRLQQNLVDQLQNRADTSCTENKAFTDPPPFLQNAPVQNQARVQDPPTVIRSPSAGTLSASSSETDLIARDSLIPLPPALVEDIVNGVVGSGRWTDFAFKINLTNEQIDQYETQTADGFKCMRKAFEDWCGKQHDKKRIVPQLLYILGILDLKGLKDRVLKWNDSQGHKFAFPTERPKVALNLNQHLSTREDNVNFTASQGEAQSPPQSPPHVPVGPPAETGSENNYSSLQSAKPIQSNPTGPQAANQIQINQMVSQVNALQIGQYAMRQIGNFEDPQAPFRAYSAPIPPSQHTSGRTVPRNAYGMPMGGQLYHAPPQAAPQPMNILPRPGPNLGIDSAELPTYAMSSSPRGWCVIINNRDFRVDPNDREGKEMPQRTGTDIDAQQLQHVFETLGFEVRRRDNLTHIQMMNYLIDVSYNVDHSKFDCFVCCILTHGVLNHLYGTDGRLVSIKDLTTTFQANRCPTLAGKPKLFFLQACQGRDKMGGGQRVIERDAAGGPETDADEMIPNEADFLIGYATVPGYVSFRSRTHGSWFIRKLCENLEKLSHREDLVSILVQVNNEVSKANANIDDGIYKQIPAPLVTLTKKLFFR